MAECNWNPNKHEGKQCPTHGGETSEYKNKLNSAEKHQDDSLENSKYSNVEDMVKNVNLDELKKSNEESKKEFMDLKNTVNHKNKEYFTNTPKSASLTRHLNGLGSLTPEEEQIVKETDEDLKNNPVTKDYTVYRVVPKGSERGKGYIHASLSPTDIKLEARHNLEEYDYQIIKVPENSGIGMISTGNFTEKEVILPRNYDLKQESNYKGIKTYTLVKNDDLFDDDYDFENWEN